MNRLTLKVLNRARVLQFINTSATVTVNSEKVKLPIRKAMGYEHLHEAEPWMRQLLMKLKPLFPGAFVDVGVNIGQTLMKVQAIFDKPHYVGFEPNPICVAYVDEMVKLNNWKNCHIIPTGISNETGILKLNFFYESTTDSTASIIENFRANDPVDHTMYIPVFDEGYIKKFLPEVKNCFLKIDVEGAEPEVMEGLRNWINTYRPLMIVEVLPVYTNENHFRLQRQARLEALLQELNYKISRINKHSMTLEPLQSIGVHGDVSNCDYVFYPAESATGLNAVFN